ncbi:MAG: inositol monophosphatase family protein, partial [Desulfobaccales bacterium]
MTEKDFELIIQVGRRAALAAGFLLKLNYEQPHDITLKSAIDPVTESDLASQETIISLIRLNFPDHGILAEEEGVNVDVSDKAEPATQPSQAPLSGLEGGSGGRAGTSGPWPSP